VGRGEFIQEIARRIGRRKLVWFGVVGGNVRPLTQLPQLSEVYSIVAPAGISGDRDVCLERLTGERVHTVEYKLRPAESAIERDFHRRLCASLSEPAVTVTHQASPFFFSAYFLRQEFVQHLGLFHERQTVFDHKPWVESELRKVGVTVLPWRYLSTYERPALVGALEDALRDGAIVLRANRSDGGEGLTLVRQPGEIPSELQDTTADGFMAMAPFFEPSVPLNANACVFPDGAVSFHSPSVQLIGLPGSSLSRFGYCGNDFARVRDLDRAVFRDLQEMTTQAGRWLSSMGYVGAFGVDALLHRGKVYLTEVNPRFQGSSLLSAHLDAELDRPDVFLEHVGAFLGVPAPDPWDLDTMAQEQPRAAQISARNGLERVSRNNSGREPPDGVDCWLLPDHGVVVHPHALLSRVVVRDAVTEDGWQLRADVASWFSQLPGMLFDAVETAGR